MASKYIKNTTVGIKTYQGQDIAAGAYYEVQEIEHTTWTSDEVLKADVESGDAVVAAANDGSDDYTPINGWLYFIGKLNDVVITSYAVDPPPFAKPDYRTKRNATGSLATVAANTNQTVDFQITEALYVSGGTLILSGNELGDYVTAEVHDVDSVIPVEYRAATCEAWPTVAKYVIKEWVAPTSSHEIDTRPLNAALSAGLYLRVTYYTANSGSTRTIGINYNLTKKLT